MLNSLVLLLLLVLKTACLGSYRVGVALLNRAGKVVLSIIVVVVVLSTHIV